MTRGPPPSPPLPPHTCAPLCAPLCAVPTLEALTVHARTCGSALCPVATPRDLRQSPTSHTPRPQNPKDFVRTFVEVNARGALRSVGVEYSVGFLANAQKLPSQNVQNITLAPGRQ